MTKIPFRCARCLLFVEIDADRHRAAVRNVVKGYPHRRPGHGLYPEGWALVVTREGEHWRCAECRKEVAAGSPEWLGGPA